MKATPLELVSQQQRYICGLEHEIESRRTRQIVLRSSLALNAILMVVLALIGWA